MKVCKNPACGAALPDEKPGQRGRKRKYCSDACRHQHQLISQSAYPFAVSMPCKGYRRNGDKCAVIIDVGGRRGRPAYFCSAECRNGYKRRLLFGE